MVNPQRCLVIIEQSYMNFVATRTVVRAPLVMKTNAQWAHDEWNVLKLMD